MSHRSPKRRVPDRTDLVRRYRKLLIRERRMQKLLRHLSLLIEREERRREGDLPVIRF